MRALTFMLDDEALAAWKPVPVSGGVPEDWDPRLLGEEDNVHLAVYDAQRNGVIVWPFADVIKAAIEYDYSADGDGGGYVWTLHLERQDVATIRLASSRREQRRIVSDGTVGRDALRSILQDAVDAANQLLADYTAWLGVTGPLKLVIIRHHHGELYHVVTDEESARDELHDFVSEWWDPRARDAMPNDRDEAINDYFARSVEDSYSIHDVMLGGPHPAGLAPAAVKRGPMTMIDVLGGQVRVWEPDILQNDLGRMYVMDALGVSLLVREREDGTYVHIEDEGVVRKPLLVEVNNGGEHTYGDDK